MTARFDEGMGGGWKGQGRDLIISGAGAMSRAVAQSSPSSLLPDTGIDENNLVARKPRGDLKCRESSGR